MFSCFKTEIVQYETWNRNPVTKESGLQVNSIQAQNFKFDGGKFLYKYDETMWADTENYFSSFFDIKFANFDEFFIFFATFWPFFDKIDLVFSPTQ